MSDEVGNIHWPQVKRGTHTVENLPSVFIATETATGKRFLVNWSSFDAREAQREMRRMTDVYPTPKP